MKKIPVGRLFEARPHEWVLTTYDPGVIGQRVHSHWRVVPDWIYNRKTPSSIARSERRAYDEWNAGLLQ